MNRSRPLLAVFLLVCAMVAGCSSSAASRAGSTSASPSATERVSVRIASLQGPTTMGLVKLMDDARQGTGTQDYQVSMYGTPDEVVPKIANGDADIALIPSNLAAVLYNKTHTEAGPKIQVAAINTLGVLEVVESGDTVHSLADLKGRTVHSTGKGTTPEFVVDHLLAQNGVNPSTDVTIDYRSQATEVAAVLAQTPGAIGILPQPFVTQLEAQNHSVRSALSLTDEWTKTNPDSQLITGVTVVSTAFATRHPQALADFLVDAQASIAFTNDHPEEAGKLIAAQGIVSSAAVGQAAIPACNIRYIAGATMQAELSGYLAVLAKADPSSVGGSLPGADFYYGSGS